MISTKYKCIFVEVPKTGSTSIRSVLGNSSKPHLNICQLRDLIDPESFERFFKFGFVRNPWDRVVSLYEREEGLQMKDKMSFEEFVEWMKFASSTCVHPVPHRFQLDWFVDPHGNVIIDFIGRFENLEKDWEYVAQKIGASSEIPHKNENIKRKHYTEYYSPKTKRIVEERFAVDIEYFNYRFS